MMVLLLLTGCTQTIFFPPDLWAWDSADTADPRGTAAGGQVIVESVSWGCDADDTAWKWTATTSGWTSGATLNIYETGNPRAWEEEHDMAIVDSDPDGAWDELALGPLPDATPEESWLPNSNTVFDCQTDQSTTSFAVRIYDHLGELTDCVVWGHYPEDAEAALNASVRDIGGCFYLST